MGNPNTADHLALVTCTVVVWSAVDVIGAFVDAIARGDPPDSEIISYPKRRPGEPLRALVKNKRTGRLYVYEMDLVTGKPTLHVPQETSR